MDEPNGILRMIPGQVIGSASLAFPKPGPDQPETMEAVVDALDGRGMVRIRYQLKENRHGKSSTWAGCPSMLKWILSRKFAVLSQ